MRPGWATNCRINAGMMRILDRLEDTPAQVVTGTGETIIQTRLAVALFGDQTHFTGLARSIIYRWFTDPNERTIYLIVRFWSIPISPSLCWCSPPPPARRTTTNSGCSR